MKLPFFQFFPADWLMDTRPLSLATRGAWIDMLCILHNSVTRGCVTMPVIGWARSIGATAEQAGAVIDELATMRVAEIATEANGDVTVTCRRMKRDMLTREQTRLRVAKHRFASGDATVKRPCNNRCNAPGNGDVTDKKTEVRSQKSENKLESPPAPRARNELLDALCKHAELTDPLAAPDTLWPKLAKALKTIKTATPEVSPKEIEVRCQNYRLHFRDAAISSTALAAHWGRLAEPPELAMAADTRGRAGW